MRKLQIFTLAILLFAVIGCTKTGTDTVANKVQSSATEERLAPNGNSGPSANGQGGLLLNGRVQHFAFHASIDKDGMVSGSFESKSPGQDFRTHGTITCLVLQDNKTAIMSGVITKITGDGFPGVVEGTPVWFKVRDNGEGANSPEDQFSDYYLGLSGCVDYGLPLLPITNGNIQVKP